jgi:hypothetical protein
MPQAGAKQERKPWEGGRGSSVAYEVLMAANHSWRQNHENAIAYTIAVNKCHLCLRQYGTLRIKGLAEQ